MVIEFLDHFIAQGAVPVFQTRTVIGIIVLNMAMQWSFF